MAWCYLDCHKKSMDRKGCTFYNEWGVIPTKPVLCSTARRKGCCAVLNEDKAIAWKQRMSDMQNIAKRSW